MSEENIPLSELELLRGTSMYRIMNDFAQYYGLGGFFKCFTCIVADRYAGEPQYSDIIRSTVILQGIFADHALAKHTRDYEEHPKKPDPKYMYNHAKLNEEKEDE